MVRAGGTTGPVVSPSLSQSMLVELSQSGGGTEGPRGGRGQYILGFPRNLAKFQLETWAIQRMPCEEIECSVFLSEETFKHLRCGQCD